MTLPTSGAITASMINVELGRAANAAFSLNDTAVRALAGKPTGGISFNDFYGKSSYTREPATGEYYGGLMYWEVKGAFCYIYWNGLMVEVFLAATVELVRNGWRYHRGAYKGVVNGSKMYGVWRETAGTNTATYIEVREPETDGHYSGTHRWRESQAGVGYIVWGGQESFVGSGGYSSYQEGGWTYYKGDFVEKYPNNASGENYYKIYRTKIEEYVPPPKREPETGENYDRTSYLNKFTWFA